MCSIGACVVLPTEQRSRDVSQLALCVSRSVVSDSLQTHGLQPATLLCPWDFPGKNTEVGCHSLLQRIFLTQGLTPGLLHCRQILYHLSHQGSPEFFSEVECPSLGLRLHSHGLSLLGTSFLKLWKSEVVSMALAGMDSVMQ